MATHAADAVLTGSGAPAQAERFLFSPLIDFLCLGGSTLLLLPIVLALGGRDDYAGMAATMLIIAHLLNHPHFAASYQIFYRGFRQKLRGALGRHFMFAGIIVPALLGAFFLYGTLTASTRLLGYAANLMALAVGWHYVKQGYGMLMVDAALKRRFLDERAKRVLLVNCYMTWAASWLGFNAVASQHDLWGLAYYSFAIPQPIITVAAGAAALSGAGALWVLGQDWRRTGTLPVNGAIAYFVSLYAWLMFITINPIWALMVPALHSLQYLVVVSRFQLNYETDRLSDERYKSRSLVRRCFGRHPLPHMAIFFLVAGALGWVGFWGLPTVLDGLVGYDDVGLTPTLFLFFFWVFINVHHYFMDSVMWRRENPDTRRYLFS
jgi:hypothetical protein